MTQFKVSLSLTFKGIQYSDKNFKKVAEWHFLNGLSILTLHFNKWSSAWVQIKLYFDTDRMTFGAVCATPLFQYSTITLYFNGYREEQEFFNK